MYFIHKAIQNIAKYPNNNKIQSFLLLSLSSTRFFDVFFFFFSANFISLKKKITNYHIIHVSDSINEINANVAFIIYYLCIQNSDTQRWRTRMKRDFFFSFGFLFLIWKILYKWSAVGICLKLIQLNKLLLWKWLFSKLVDTWIHTIVYYRFTLRCFTCTTSCNWLTVKQQSYIYLNRTPRRKKNETKKKRIE